MRLTNLLGGKELLQRIAEKLRRNFDGLGAAIGDSMSNDSIKWLEKIGKGDEALEEALKIEEQEELRRISDAALEIAGDIFETRNGCLDLLASHQFETQAKLPNGNIQRCKRCGWTYLMDLWGKNTPLDQYNKPLPEPEAVRRMTTPCPNKP